MEFTQKQMDVINYYCENDMKNLKVVCDKLLKKIKSAMHVVGMYDYEELYSIALEKIMYVVQKSNSLELDKIEGILYTTLQCKYIDLIRKQGTEKRCGVNTRHGNIEGLNRTVSLDQKLNNDTNDTILDTVVEEKYECNENIELYMESLTDLQKKIILMLADGYKEGEIMKELNLTYFKYNRQLKLAREKSKIDLLYK